jgi:hypothetical protein
MTSIARRRSARPPLPSLGAIASEYGDRDAAVVAAHATSGYSNKQIGDHFAVNFTTVGRSVCAAKARTS